MFSKNLNHAVTVIALNLLLLCGIVVGGYFYYFTPEYSRIGYQPVQAVSFSHRTHTDLLMIDCRYCHYAVEQSWYAGMPEPSLCMNCHNQALARDSRLEVVRRSVLEGTSLYYTRVHRLPDYVWFNHGVHTRRGVACVSCHGDVSKMDKTYHQKSLSMKFCLDCHRNPAPWIIPLDEVVKSNPANFEQGLAKQWNIKTSDECSQCHR